MGNEELRRRIGAQSGVAGISRIQSHGPTYRRRQLHVERGLHFRVPHTWLNSAHDVEAPELRSVSRSGSSAPRTAFAVSGWTSGCMESGRNTSAVSWTLPAPVKPRGLTPTIVSTASLSLMVCPRTEGERANSRFHRLSLMAATAPIPGASLWAQRNAGRPGNRSPKVWQAYRSVGCPFARASPPSNDRTRMASASACSLGDCIGR